MRVAALVGVTVVALAACGSSPTHPSAVAPPATPSAAPPTTVAPAPTGAVLSVTASDGGRTVTVGAGGEVRVELSTGALWSPPRSTDSRVLDRVSGSTSPTGAATATFAAVGRGTTRIEATRRCLPRTGRVCGMFVALWWVTVHAG
jgi:hypothetical protein